jgi:hypothetical protein
MAYALRTSAGPIELAYGQSVSAGDVAFSFETMLSWSATGRAAFGIVPIVEPGPVPAGKVATGSTLQDDNGTVRRVWTLEDAPPASEPVKSLTYVGNCRISADATTGALTILSQTENVSSVARLSKGWIRVFSGDATSTEPLFATPIPNDSAIRLARVIKQTSSAVDIKTTDQLWAAADPKEMFIKLERMA